MSREVLDRPGGSQLFTLELPFAGVADGRPGFGLEVDDALVVIGVSENSTARESSVRVCYVKSCFRDSVESEFAVDNFSLHKCCGRLREACGSTQ